MTKQSRRRQMVITASLIFLGISLIMTPTAVLAGGKQEKDETIQECIIRELKEELGITVEVGDFLTTVRHAYSHFTMEMHTYYARIRSGRPRPLHCKDYRWVEISRMREVPYSRADLYIIDELERIRA